MYDSRPRAFEQNYLLPFKTFMDETDRRLDAWKTSAAAAWDACGPQGSRIDKEPSEAKLAEWKSRPEPTFEKSASSDYKQKVRAEHKGKHDATPEAKHKWVAKLQDTVVRSYESAYSGWRRIPAQLTKLAPWGRTPRVDDPDNTEGKRMLGKTWVNTVFQKDISDGLPGAQSNCSPDRDSNCPAQPPFPGAIYKHSFAFCYNGTSVHWKQNKLEHPITGKDATFGKTDLPAKHYLHYRIAYALYTVDGLSFGPPSWAKPHGVPKCDSNFRKSDEKVPVPPKLRQGQLPPPPKPPKRRISTVFRPIGAQDSPPPPRDSPPPPKLPKGPPPL
jgi:hypothetical protein